LIVSNSSFRRAVPPGIAIMRPWIASTDRLRQLHIAARDETTSAK
jgi:hypothetical protein